MNIIKCKTLQPFSKYEKNDSILIFGRIARIRRSAPENYLLHSIASDESGNIYEIYTDYDACLVSSDAIAVQIKKGV